MLHHPQCCFKSLKPLGWAIVAIFAPCIQVWWSRKKQLQTSSAPSLATLLTIFTMQIMQAASRLLQQLQSTCASWSACGSHYRRIQGASSLYRHQATWFGRIQKDCKLLFAIISAICVGLQGLLQHFEILHATKEHKGLPTRTKTKSKFIQNSEVFGSSEVLLWRLGLSLPAGPCQQKGKYIVWSYYCDATMLLLFFLIVKGYSSAQTQRHG